MRLLLACLVTMYYIVGWLRNQCFGHRLHLAICSGLNDDRIKSATTSMKSAIGHFNRSHVKTQRLLEAQVSRYMLCD